MGLRTTSPRKKIIDNIYERGIYKQELKLKNPIFKTGGRKQPANYRPITLLSILTKILEQGLKHQLLIFLDKKQREFISKILL